VSRRRPPTDATLEQALAWPGPGRKATPAHPLCTCRKPIDYPPRPDELGLFREWLQKCEAVRLAAHCPVHNVTPSVWTKPL
jgi:hypothetical protein